MYPVQMEKALERERKSKFVKFVGVFEKHSLPQKLPDTCSFIFDYRDHASAIMIENSFGYYFCSNGNYPPKVIVNYLLSKIKVKHIKYNSIEFQGPTEMLCTYYCVLFCKFISIGITFNDFCSLLESVDSSDKFLRSTMKLQYGIHIPSTWKWHAYWLPLTCENCSTKCKSHGFIVEELIRRNMWFQK